MYFLKTQNFTTSLGDNRLTSGIDNNFQELRSKIVPFHLKFTFVQTKMKFVGK